MPPIVALGDKAAFTVAEAADLISLGQTMTRAVIAEGRLKVVRVGRAILVPRSEIDAFLAREAAAQAPLNIAPREVQLLRVIADARAITIAARQLTAEADVVNTNLRNLMDSAG